MCGLWYLSFGMQRMKKGRKRRDARSKAAGIVVDRPGLILDKCRSALGSLLRDVHGLGFNQKALAGGESEFLLSGSPLSFGAARGRYPVLPLLRTKTDIFWIGVSLRFI